MNTEELKLQTIRHLASIGIEVPEHLPRIEEFDEVKPRSAEDVAGRLCALAYVVGLGFDAKGKDLSKHLEAYKLMPHVSEQEKALLAQDIISEQDAIDMTWRTEGMQALAWCIGLVELDHFTHCDDDLAYKIPFKTDPDGFIHSAAMRPLEDIQAQADLLYRMHWYARNCRLTGEPCELDESIVSERRRAIDWVYGIEEDWDEVPLDT